MKDDPQLRGSDEAFEKKNSRKNKGVCGVVPAPCKDTEPLAGPGQAIGGFFKEYLDTGTRRRFNESGRIEAPKGSLPVQFL